MANNYSTPKRIVKLLLDDSYSQVSEEATRCLDN